MYIQPVMDGYQIQPPQKYVCYVIPFWEPPALPIHYFHRAKYDVLSSYDEIP